MTRDLDVSRLKLSYATRLVPPAAMAAQVPLAHRPQLGQLVLARVEKLGRNTSLENQHGVPMPLFPGDQIVGVFGHRYATHQYEGYVPTRAVNRCDLLSGGGVCGKVASQHSGVRSPTRLQILGLVADYAGEPLSSRSFARPALGPTVGANVILVVGASMDSGKTTTVSTLTRMLVGQGLRVAAGKLTGTAAARDTRLYVASGADPVFDFIDAGYPSTYMLDAEQVFELLDVVISQLRASRPDYIVLEIADGIFQRETRMLLGSERFRSLVDHLFFSANDSLSAESGVRNLRAYGLPLRAITGRLTSSPLGMREAEELTGVPCLSTARILEGDAINLLRLPRPLLTTSARTLLPLPKNGAGAPHDGSHSAVPPVASDLPASVASEVTPNVSGISGVTVRATG
jgi:hypothetical protein